MGILWWKHHESVFTKFYQSYILPVKFNIDKRKVHLSAQIKMEKYGAAALDELQMPVYNEVDLERDFEFVKKLDFKIDELKTILQNKPVSHLDFATDRTFIEPLIKIAKFLGVTTFK